jgi:hypothetical protein
MMAGSPGRRSRSRPTGLAARGDDDLVGVSDDVAVNDLWLIMHPDVRRDPRVRATADFLKQIATGPSGLC